MRLFFFFLFCSDIVRYWNECFGGTESLSPPERLITPQLTVSSIGRLSLQLAFHGSTYLPYCKSLKLFVGFSLWYILLQRSAVFVRLAEMNTFLLLLFGSTGR